MSSAYPIQQIRNIGIIAHIDAGKTTLTERILYYSGRSHRIGEVDQGTTVTDWMEQERERGITITAAAVSTTWQDSQGGAEAQINIIDTPGHIDFTAEVQRSLRVLDGGVVVLDSVSGVEPQSETVWRQADLYGVPRICFINKMDRVGANFERAVQTLVERLGANPLPLQLPIGSEDNFEGLIDLFLMQALLFDGQPGTEPRLQPIPAHLQAAARDARARMVERIAESDDELTAQYLRGETISRRALYEALRRAVIANSLVPVLAGSALHNKGVQPLLDAIARYLPSPADIPQVEGIDPRANAPTTPLPLRSEDLRRADPDAPFCALVFKVVSDPYVGRLVYVRIYSGALKSGGRVYNARRQRQERVSRLLLMYADKRQVIQNCGAGDIVALVGPKQSFTGDTLCDPEHEILLEAIEFPMPVIKAAIEPQIEGDQERLARALQKLAEEDPTFQVGYDQQTSQTVISGMGELHLDIIVDRLRREFEVQCDAGPPQVAYQETITRAARGEGRYIHQSGGSGHYAVVQLEVSPNEPGAGLVFENRTSGAIIPESFVPAIEKGVVEAAQGGVLAGFPLTDLRVSVIGGKYHEVDSHKMNFEIAGSMALKQACKKAGLVLLEPIMQVETRVTEEQVGSVVNDFSGRRGRIEGIGQRGQGLYTIQAVVPLRNMFGYVTALRSMSSGRGIFSMEFERYAPVEQAVADEIAGEKRKPLPGSSSRTRDPGLLRK